MFAKISAMGLVHIECSTKTRIKMYPTCNSFTAVMSMFFLPP